MLFVLICFIFHSYLFLHIVSQNISFWIIFYLLHRRPDEFCGLLTIISVTALVKMHVQYSLVRVAKLAEVCYICTILAYLFFNLINFLAQRFISGLSLNLKIHRNQFFWKSYFIEETYVTYLYLFLKKMDTHNLKTGAFEFRNQLLLNLFMRTKKNSNLCSPQDYNSNKIF